MMTFLPPPKTMCTGARSRVGDTLDGARSRGREQKARSSYMDRIDDGGEADVLRRLRQAQGSAQGEAKAIAAAEWEKSDSRRATVGASRYEYLSVGTEYERLKF